MKWRWLTLVLSLTLLPGCSLILGINPYAARPICPPAGAMLDSDKELTEQEMNERHILTKECFNVREIKVIDEKAGRACGKVPLSQVQKLVKESDGFDVGDLNRYMTTIENVPRFEDCFQVKGGTAGLTKGKVAHFVREPGSNALTYYTPEQMCAKNEDMIREHAVKFDYWGYDIPAEYIQECPNLAHVWEKKN